MPNRTATWTGRDAQAVEGQPPVQQAAQCRLSFAQEGSNQWAVEYFHSATRQITMLAVRMTAQYSTTRSNEILPVQDLVAISIPD